ncbi:MAG: hypothetical protein ACI81L_000966 [Verrucomicrobiales bacterium]
MIGRKALDKATALPQPARDVYVWLNRNIGRLDPTERALPNFYVAGTQRGGTTSLFIYLLAHELVHGPRRAKGVHYFDTSFEKSIGWYRSNFPRYATLQKQAATHGVEPAVGEGAPYYLFNPAVPARIHRVSPDARILTVLREPLDRAISHHNHEVKRGYESLSMSDAFDAEATRLAGEADKITADPTYVSKPHIHHSYLARGQYGEQLERYFDLFGRDQVLVLDSSALSTDPKGTVRKATDFLGLPPLSDVDYPRYNKREYDLVDPEIRAKYGPVFDDSNARLRESLAPGTLSWL